MKVIGYIRVSTQGQVNDGVSLEAQKAKIMAWADLNGYEQVEIFEDAGISGKRADNRNGLQEALKIVNKDDVLIVYSLSRLARSTKNTLEISEALQKKKADLVSLSEKIDTTSAAGKMVFRMLAVLNEFERDQISERTKAALQYKKSNGEKTGGSVPYGYDVDKHGNLIENKHEQKAIRLINDLKAKGYSLRRIGMELIKEGYLTKSGKVTWHPQIIKQIIDREAA